MRPLPRAELMIGAALIEHRHDLSTTEQFALRKFLGHRVTRSAYKVIAEAMGWPRGKKTPYLQLYLDQPTLADNATRRASLNLEIVPGVKMPALPYRRRRRNRLYTGDEELPP